MSRHTCDHASWNGDGGVHLCDCLQVGRDHTADQLDGRWLAPNSFVGYVRSAPPRGSAAVYYRRTR